MRLRFGTRDLRPPGPRIVYMSLSSVEWRQLFQDWRCAQYLVLVFLCGG